MSTDRQSTSFKFRGGSFHALVVRPEDPIRGWLADVDALLSRSPGFFVGKSVVIDLSGLTPTRDGFLALLDELSKREIRILGVEGADPTSVDDRVPFLTRGRTDIENPTTPVTPAPAPALASSLLIDTPVRSGQLIRRGRDCCGLSRIRRGDCRRWLHSCLWNFTRKSSGGRLRKPERSDFLSKARSRTNGH